MGTSSPRGQKSLSDIALASFLCKRKVQSSVVGRELTTQGVRSSFRSWRGENSYASDKVFMPFSKLDNNQTRTTDGYGLSLVKLTAELHYVSDFLITNFLGESYFIVTLI